MSTHPASKFVVPVDKQSRITSLLKVPLVSPAVLGLLLLSTGGVVLSDVLAVSGVISLVAACALNTFLMYWQFTVVHDAIHRSAARNQRLNDWLGRIGILTFAPQVNLGLFRWAHIQHHRFTNGERDPDRWMHGAWWSLPARWMFLDIGYLIFILRHGDASSRRFLRGAGVNTAVLLAGCAALAWAGYGLHVLLLWLVPARLTFMFVGFAFFWLPHVKDDVPAEQDLTLATSMRLGRESLTSPALQWHHYHLIHHLFPTLPAYRHEAAWKLLKPELMQRNLQIQRGFAIQPEIHHGQRP